MKDISLANSQIVKDVDVKNKYKKKWIFNYIL